jgi:hypothetical protein
MASPPNGKTESQAGKASGADYRKGGNAPKGFAANPELARAMGRIGGRISKRRKITQPSVQPS